MTVTGSSRRTRSTPVHFARGGRGRRLRAGEAPRTPPPPPGRVPRLARLMALAIRLEGLLESGAARTQAELAEVGHVTRARITQIMNLLHLAPDIQEAILDLPRVESGRDPVTEREVRPIAAVVDWEEQRRIWARLIGETSAG
ncbi:MAG: hypothetical protein ACI89L_002464 [Phycisphaerales bacterium]|jgi:hypothetical protein